MISTCHDLESQPQGHDGAEHPLARSRYLLPVSLVVAQLLLFQR
uniref:Uncharacterized protein LOC104243568 n=1 Tax=Nicotiana sylvestris TaxID=4096 RepID=A0A1U7Y1S3_NICSY